MLPRYHIFLVSKGLVLDCEVYPLTSDKAASYIALEKARKLKKKGREGTVVVEREGTPVGFTYAVVVSESGRTKHPYDKLSRKPLKGWFKTSGIIRERLSGKDTVLAFWIPGEMLVSVSIQTIFKPTLSICYNDECIQVTDVAPSEFELVLYWGITPKQARDVWKGVLKGIEIECGAP